MWVQGKGDPDIWKIFENVFGRYVGSRRGDPNIWKQ